MSFYRFSLFPFISCLFGKNNMVESSVLTAYQSSNWTFLWQQLRNFKLLRFKTCDFKSFENEFWKNPTYRSCQIQNFGLRHKNHLCSRPVNNIFHETLKPWFDSISVAVQWASERLNVWKNWVFYFLKIFKKKFRDTWRQSNSSRR